MLKHRFLIHSLSHTFVVADIGLYGIPSEIIPADGGPQQMVAKPSVWELERR